MKTPFISRLNLSALCIITALALTGCDVEKRQSHSDAGTRDEKSGYTHATTSASPAKRLTVSWRDGGTAGKARMLSCMKIENGNQLMGLMFFGMLASAADVDLHTVRIDMANHSAEQMKISANEFQVLADGQRFPCLGFILADGSADETYDWVTLASGQSGEVYAMYAAPNSVLDLISSGDARLTIPVR
jgi:hypothetical protein